MWNVIDEQDDSTLPQVDYGHFLVTLEYYGGGGRRTVDKSFYTKDSLGELRKSKAHKTKKPFFSLQRGWFGFS